MMWKCKANSCHISKNYTWDEYCSYHQRCLEKLRRTYNSSFTNVHEIDTFKTWFNGNCGWVITEDHSSSSDCPFYVWIVVYEPAKGGISENISAIKYRTHCGGLGKAREIAIGLKDKLQNGGFHDTPMLDVHPLADYYQTFSSLITSPYVISEDLPYETVYTKENNPVGPDSFLRKRIPTSVPSRYLKPLDIVKVNEGNYEHVGVYIGNNLVCHFTKEDNVARIDWWETFVKGYNTYGNWAEITRYHPVIPFKNYRKIVKQIAWAEDVKFRKNNYNLNNRNCEHFANMIVYGINYSEQVANNATSLEVGGNLRAFAGGLTLGISVLLTGTPELEVNNGKGLTIKLTNEMRETDDKLGWKTNDRSGSIERRYLQEVPAKEPCRIM